MSLPLNDGPEQVVRFFLDALADGRVDEAVPLLAEDVRYVNVGFPAVRGRAAVERVLRGLDRPSFGFEVVWHSVAVDGPVVLTERTDAIRLGRVRSQFWVTGRFDVHDGLITLWRDSFDVVDLTRGTVRGLAAALIPSLSPHMPAPEDPPGR